MFGMQPNQAAMLLRYMDWNKEKLIEKFMDNPDAITIKAGVSSVAPAQASQASQPSQSSKSTSGGPVRRSTRRQNSTPKSPSLSRRTSPRPESATPADFLCPICYDDTSTKTFALSCGHRYCTNCWEAFTSSKIRQEGEHVIRCMAEGCSLVAPDDFVRRVLKDDDASWIRFRELLVRHFVGNKRALKFCPYPGCTHTVSCPAAATKASLSTQVPTVTCGADASPKHVFCFGCGLDSDHRPCVCAVARLWLKKCADDSETANWIKTNTKECSKCNSTIEKNGGCK
jgi:ariadne-1